MDPRGVYPVLSLSPNPAHTLHFFAPFRPRAPFWPISV
jgi:hypothetical protein